MPTSPCNPHASRAPDARALPRDLRSDTGYILGDPQVARDGTIWRSQSRAKPVFKGGSWTHPKVAGHTPERCGRERSKWCIETVAVGGDGSVWVTVLGDDAARNVRSDLARLRNGRWQSFPSPWDLIGATDSGEVWAVVSGPEDTEHRWIEYTDGRDGGTLNIDELYSLVGDGFEAAAVGPDGTLWVYISDGQVARSTSDPAEDRRDWAVFETPGGVSLGPYGFGHEYHMEVAPDGSLWAILQQRSDCHGLGQLADGTWTRYLEGHCVRGLDIAPDGTVWLQAVRVEDEPTSPLDTYVITPEAVAATE